MTAQSIPESGTENKVDIRNVDLADLKAKVVVDHVEVEASPKPPVADDYMYDFKYNHALPTTELLGVEVPADCDAQKEAQTIVTRLSEALGKGDPQAFADMFLEYGEIFYQGTDGDS